jgi:hypothetical protein
MPFEKLNGAWSHAYPDGCRNCGGTQRKHQARGLCATCYKKTGVLESVNNGTFIEWRDRYENLGTETIEGGPGAADSFGDDVITDEGTYIDRQRERRPGAEPSPVADTSNGPEPAGVKSKWQQAKQKLKDAANPVTSPQPRATNERRPGGGTPGNAKRVSTAETISDVWGGIGGLAQRSGRHAPLGKYLSWQAPAAGIMLDDAISGTPVDKLLQPIVKARGKLDLVAAVFGPPAIILAIERDPRKALTLIPVLKSAIRSSLPTLLPAMQKAKNQEEKIDKAVRELFPDIPEGIDPVDLIMDEMFMGYFTEVPLPTDEPISV